MSVCEPQFRASIRSAPSRVLPSVAQSRGKRAIDVAAAALALAVLAPLLVVIALAIRAETRGPAIFRQQRTGLDGAPFHILKFRTMAARASDDTAQATVGDKRVTGLGRVLRKLSFDELPQLVNVLRGEMSLVGPRPHALAHDQAWAVLVPDYAERFRARPGITGEAQVRGYRGEVLDARSIHLRVNADNEYIERWSLRSDVMIIAKTLPLLFGDTAAY